MGSQKGSRDVHKINEVKKVAKKVHKTKQVKKAAKKVHKINEVKKAAKKVHKTQQVKKAAKKVHKSNEVKKAAKKVHKILKKAQKASPKEKARRLRRPCMCSTKWPRRRPQRRKWRSRRSRPLSLSSKGAARGQKMSEAAW